MRRKEKPVRSREVLAAAGVIVLAELLPVLREKLRGECIVKSSVQTWLAEKLSLERLLILGVSF